MKTFCNYATVILKIITLGLFPSSKVAVAGNLHYDVGIVYTPDGSLS